MAVTFEKTWVFNMNTNYTPASVLDLTRYQSWWLLSTLTGNRGFTDTVGAAVASPLAFAGVWTLYASSDSVTAGTDSTDRLVLAGPYDGTKFVRANGAVAHSWCVLKSPLINGSYWYLIWSLNASNDYSAKIYCTKTAPTGGTTTASPTDAATVWSLIGSSVAEQVINGNAADKFMFSMGLTSGGTVYVVGNKQGGGIPNWSFIFTGLEEYGGSDLFPLFTYHYYAATGVLRLLTANSPSDGGNTGINRNHMREAAGGAVRVNPLLGMAATSGAAALLWEPAAVNPITGRYSDFPCYVSYALTFNSYLGKRGRLPDIALNMITAAGLPNGSVNPASGQVDSSNAGNFWFPTNAAFDFYSVI